jgi:hypothetical protein
MGRDVPVGDAARQLQEDFQAGGNAMLRPLGEALVQLAAERGPAHGIAATDMAHVPVVVPGLQPGRQHVLLHHRGAEVVIAFGLGDGPQELRRRHDPAQAHRRSQRHADRAYEHDLTRPHALKASQRGPVKVKIRALIAFTNGQTGAANPERQGLNAAILDGPPPLNILQEVPERSSQFDYSPMWDVHLATWTSAAVAAGLNVRQTDFAAALQQVANGKATGFPAGSKFGPSGFIVNCPVVSLDVNAKG